MSVTELLNSWEHVSVGAERVLTALSQKRSEQVSPLAQLQGVCKNHRHQSGSDDADASRGDAAQAPRMSFRSNIAGCSQSRTRPYMRQHMHGPNRVLKS